jgi:hypothetical protein
VYYPPAGKARRFVTALALLGSLGAGCDAGPTAPASFLPGSVASPRAMNLIASDYSFVPAVVKVIPGETVLIHVVNGGLEPHEAVVGDAAVQAAWQAAEAATAGHPPGPTPVVSVAPELAGLRVFVPSGRRVDVVWNVPRDIALTSGSPGGPTWFVGCHIPGHFEQGMVVPIEFVGSGAPGEP